MHVGNLGVKDFAPGIGDLWYYVGEESCRGKGVASAAVGEAIRWARDGLGLSRLVARVLETNIGSRAVLERNGFSLADEGFGMRDGVAMLRYELDLTDG